MLLLGDSFTVGVNVEHDTHWTAEGHALAAEVIYNDITNRKIIPDLSFKSSRSQKPLLSRMTDVTEYFTTCLEEKQHAK